MKILVCIDPYDLRSSCRLLTFVRSLTSDINAVIYDDCPVLNRYGIKNLYRISFKTGGQATSFPYARETANLVEEIHPDALFFPSTHLFRSIAPRVAVILDAGLTADCTDIVCRDGKFFMIAPAFSGNAMVTITSTAGRLPMATVLCGLLEDLPGEDVAPEVIEIESSLIADKIRLLSSMPRDVYNLQDAEIVLAAGYGIGSAENFALLANLANTIGASVGATMAAVDAGYAPSDLLIGQSGTSVSPRIYMAFGISGQYQHMAGVSSKSTIISVNTDIDCPMNQAADYVIHADAVSIIKKMISIYEKR